MTWKPETTLLGTHGELVSFSHSIQYFTPGTAADPTAEPPTTAGEDVYYPVRITPQEPNSTTISYTKIPTNPATISGYYKGIFNDTLTTRSKDGKFTTITTLSSGGGVFDAVNREQVHEVISFKADTSRSKTFSYLAEAVDTITNQVVASQIYTIKAEDKNWTPGLVNLKELVSYARSK